MDKFMFKIQTFLMGGKYGKYFFLGSILLVVLLSLGFVLSGEMKIFIWLHLIPGIYAGCVGLVLIYELLKFFIIEPIRKLFKMDK